jgi:outer membrane protein assembly factor BamB
MKRLLLLASVLLASTALAANWPAWRGPLGTGITEEKDLPTKWSKTENVKWNVPLPAPGNSTPVVWGDRIFLTQAVGDQRTLMCLGRADGKVLWQQGVSAKEKEPTHQTNPYASQSPVTDGERVIVAFASEGLFCYDFDGKELWSRTDLGRQIHIWGAGTSPVIHGDLCFLNFGPGATTYLLAVDKKTGRTIWKHDEDIGYGDSSKEKPQARTGVGSWSTPVLMNVEGKEQVLISWPRRLAAYDPATGKELWTCAGLTPLVYTSPIYGDGIAVALSGFSGSGMAVRAGGSGDVTESRRLWHQPRSPQRIGSGVVHEGRIYIHNDPGTAMCLDLKTGDLIWQEKLRGGTNWSSVMLSGDKCYMMTQGGTCLVFRASPQFELISENTLGERSNSSVVPSNGELFLRTHRSLWCIAEKR